MSIISLALILLGRRSDVPGTGANHLVGLILLDAMTNPTNRSSQGEERYRAARRQMQCTGERDESEKNRWAFAEQVICFLCDSLRKKHSGRLWMGLSKQLKQEFSPWVAHRVENRAKSGNYFSKSENGFSSFEQARHRRTDVVGRVRFPEKCSNPFCLPGMLDPLKGR